MTDTVFVRNESNWRKVFAALAAMPLCALPFAQSYGGLPDDLSMLRMTGLTGRKTCTFAASGNTLKAKIEKR